MKDTNVPGSEMIFKTPKRLAERRAKFVYEGIRRLRLALD